MHFRHWDKTIMVNPFVRYYFLNKKISPIVETSFYHGFEFDVDPRFDNNREVSEVILNLGISTPRLLFNRFGFDVTSGFISSYRNERFNRFRYAPITMIRITYSIRNK